ncbi:MAG: DedA family protein [Candidatus Pacearchaeota archaeon]
MLENIFVDIFNALIKIIGDLGYAGIFLGMMIESTIFPLPSELILIPAGALVATGKMSFSGVLLAAVAGTIFGAMINFLFAMFLGRNLVNMLVKKYGRFLFITEAKLRQTDEYFQKHGEITTFIGRLIPVARHIISLPAGFSQMNVLKFIIYTALGAAVWSSFLVYLGYLFWDRIEWINGQLNFFFIPLLVLALIIVIIYLLLHKNYNHKHKRKKK